MFVQHRPPFFCLCLLALALAGCPSAPSVVTDAGTPPRDVPPGDAPSSGDGAIDAPIALDVSRPLDVPMPVDTPMAADTPTPIDVGDLDANDVDTSVPADGGMLADVPDDAGMSVDVGSDAPPMSDAPLQLCGMPGQVGGHCSLVACMSGVLCQNEIMEAGVGLYTIESAFLIEQGEPDPSAPGFYRVDPTPVVGAEVPLPMATGSICTNVCDAGAAVDTCGACSTCATDIGTVGVLATYLLYPVADRVFGNDTGWCRADCDFDPAVAGPECPSGHTCSPATRVCVESCVRDTECQFSFEQTREGEFVTSIDVTAGACNTTTGRCEWTHAGTESVGDPCDRASDCTEDVGICLNGGTCGEYDCANAADTDATFVCDGGRGICLGNGGNAASVCVAGCVAASDCNPGNTCIPLGMAVGPYRGYCLGICDEFRNDPDGPGPLTAADDVLWPCQTGEACDQPPPNGGNLDPNGSCQPTCTSDAQCTGTAERCDIPAGMTTGFCRVPDQVCDRVALSVDCSLGQVCDLLAYPDVLGLCVAPCMSVADCVPDVCSSREVCRVVCSGTGMSTCNVDETCQAGLCEQSPTL